MEVQRGLCLLQPDDYTRPDEFVASLWFLERSTGIPSLGRDLPPGTLRRQRTCEAVTAWQGWWATNRNDASFDVAADRLRLGASPSVDATAAHAVAEREWNEAISVPRRWCDPSGVSSVNSRESAWSLKFLERSTGVDARAVGTPIGLMPSRGTCDSLRHWEAWWAAHGDHVVYDIEADALRISGR